MKSSSLFSIVAAACVAVAFFAAPTGAYAQPHGQKVQDQSFVVVKINDDYKVVQSASLAQEKKTAQEDYKKKYEEYKELKLSDPTLKPPTKLVFKSVGPKFKTQEGADAYKKKMEDDDDKNAGKNNKK